MKNAITIFTAVIIYSLILPSCGPVDPSEKAFYKLSESKPYRFDKGGVVETWDQGKEYWDKSCRSVGRWKLDGNIVVVEGVSNSYCPHMSKRNGRFKLNGEFLERQ